MNGNSPYEVNGFSLEAIRNRNEMRVIRMMRRMLPETPDFCGCRLCVEDVYAATLSRLPSHYAQVGSIVVRAETTDSEIAHELRRSLDRVREHPTHPPLSA